MNDFQKYIHISKYARWMDEKGRRENWDETVGRYIEFFRNRPRVKNADHPHMEADLGKLYNAIYNLEVLPSMRCFMTAGRALERDEVAGYNCAAIAINNVRSFDEMFYLLMNGCGVGFSVERQYINQLPSLPEELYDSESVIKVRDSKIGWASSLKELIASLYAGSVPTWDVSSVRPAGTRLRTFGGRASGPEPLISLFHFVVRTFRRGVSERKEKLNSLEVHDICCKIADTVIAGSVRRAACISFSNLTDDRLRRAKVGDWYSVAPYRALANNSVAYTEKPDLDAFSKEWRTLYKSKSGERGIVNKEALRAKAEGCGREWEGDYLLNP